VVQPLPSLRCAVAPSPAVERAPPLPGVAPSPPHPCVALLCAALPFLLFAVASRRKAGRAPPLHVLRRRLRLGHPCAAPSRGDGDPVGDGFPAGGGDGRKSPPASVGGGGAGENVSPRGRGWEADPRRGIPRCHPYLAATYRGLCTSVAKGTTIEGVFLGCPLLVQLWSYERLIVGRPCVDQEPYAQLLADHDDVDRPTMDSLWCLRKVMSGALQFLYFSVKLIICNN
jgi:hypothetical protein